MGAPQVIREVINRLLCRSFVSLPPDQRLRVVTVNRPLAVARQTQRTDALR